MLAGIDHYGYFGTKAGAAPEYPSLQTRWDPTTIFQNVTNPTPSDIGAILAMIAGGAAAVILGLLRLRFYWWPLHPIGYLAANCRAWNYYWVPFFLGWGCKLLVMRYGGLRLYRITIPRCDWVHYSHDDGPRHLGTRHAGDARKGVASRRRGHRR
ncbi:MAG TPA: DUF6784 domain-containing protein [Armatimonadota bacterium]|nr:DUF6784 domain-containing protein [Armatimonadota bacterium]